MKLENIRNFAIIAHIDHGKSTLADRFLEITKTVDPREMKAQYLDQLELERERGITIKMAPVRMKYSLTTNDQRPTAEEYILNLIDTPGHPDFGYEVSRAFKAVEGAILLVDASQGIQAQTLANYEMAKKAGLKILGAVNKIDLNSPQIETVLKETAELLECSPDEIFKISGKTGFGIKELLEAVIKKLPSPASKETYNELSALVFDSLYDDHKGIIAFVRIFGGEFKAHQETKLIAVNERFKIKEVGFFTPQMKANSNIQKGEIGYIATGLKNPDQLRIGDTIGNRAFAGYQEPQPRVFVSFFPEDGGQYDELKKSFQKLKLNDAALKLEPDSNEVLGRGFKVGFLGKLHFEITSQRLEKEFGIKTVNSFPSVSYKIGTKQGYIIIENPADLPDEYIEIWELMIDLEILTPAAYMGSILSIKESFRMGDIESHNLGQRILMKTKMPLMELISDFDDQLKSATHGFASFSYFLTDYKKADLVKIDVYVAKDLVIGLSRIVPKNKMEYEARQMAQRLKDLLPQQQFSQAIQISAGSRIIARETIPALRKDVTGCLYGGDRTRKMKLWKKQKKGKKKLLEMAKVNISADVFKELLKK
ncbi:MAG: translation elongation factor 4 [Patescibacteria group bacterium]|nr:translation elongation factor 4 [Patescibacteria group bacterium]